jgi:hypothetical protein
LFIVATSSFVIAFAILTPTNTSAPKIASCRVQEIFSGFEISRIFIFAEFRSTLLFDTIHLLSQAIILPTQYKLRSFKIAVPAAPSQFITTFISSFFLPVILSEFISQASTTTAVPC